MENQKKAKSLLSGAFLLAFVFLFNPNLNIIDILPDFIGYAILCITLSRLSALNENIELAQKGFFRALCLDVAKFICIFVVFAMQNPDEKNTLLLLGSFVFAVAELLILIPAYGNLFGGLIGLGYKYDNASVLSYRKAKSRKNRTEKIRSFTVFFLIVKVLMYTLPEFAVLSTQNYDDMSSTLYIYNFIGLLRFFAIAFGLIVGFIWLLRIISYFRRVQGDAKFMGALVSDYNLNVLPKKSLFVRKSVKFISLLFCIAALLCIDFRIESFNVLVDTLAAIVLIISALSAKKHIVKGYKSIIPFAVYAVISFVAVIFEFRFFGEHYYGAIWRDDAAYVSYVYMLVFSVLDVLSFLFAVWGMSNILKTVVKEHTGFYVPNATVNVEEKIKRVHSELNKKIYLLYAAGILSAAADLFYDFGAHAIRFAGLVNTVCSLIFFCAVFYVTDAIGEEVESKYMLE